MSHRRFRRLGLAACLAALASVPAHATSVRPMNVVQLLEHSSTIVAANVKSVTDGFDAGGVISLRQFSRTL